MGQAKQRGTYEERVKMANKGLRLAEDTTISNTNNGVDNETSYDILVRMYQDVGLDELECGTLRLPVSANKLKEARNQLSHYTKAQLSNQLATAMKECNCDGIEILKHPEYKHLGAIMVAYLTHYQSWNMLELVMGDNPIPVLVDYYNNAPHRGPGRYEFVLRGSAGDWSNDFNEFEKTRIRFHPTKY
jgi:hypothetical protein